MKIDSETSFNFYQRLRGLRKMIVSVKFLG